MHLSVQGILQLFLLVSTSALAVTQLVDPDAEVLDPENYRSMDIKVDYQNLRGRVTDKSDEGKILKIKTQNNNIKFFKINDPIKFSINNIDLPVRCRGLVQSLEDYYMVIKVENLSLCYPEDRYLPRGVLVNIEAPRLVQRVFEVTQYRDILSLKKDGFLKQLQSINNFLWAYPQEKINLAASYDEQINEIKKQKRIALDQLLDKKAEQIRLQGELRSKLNQLDGELEFYKVERQEYLLDRWNMDHDLGHPVGQRPQKTKQL